MKLTETEIEKQASVIATELHGFEPEHDAGGNQEWYCYVHGAVKGANWAISQMQPEWMACSDRLPEIGTPVIVQTEYLDKGKPVSEVFSGYMDESGELYVYPNDDHYGWTFEECVTQWCVLPQPPTK